jgi:membrane-bound serine protease (ClpP class)
MVPGNNDAENVVLKKATEDMAALLRSIAERRGRNTEASEQAVFEAKAYEETVALELGLIDLVAGDQDELLRLLDGREVTRFDGSVAVLATSEARLVETEFSYRHRFMELLGTPAVALVLFLLGVLGIYVELTTPGVVLPGVVGALCLLLFALSAQVLPISIIGALLIVLAIVMFVLEIKVTSYGMLSFGGVVSMLIGSWMLVDGPIPALRVPPVVFVPACLVIAGLCVLAVVLALRAQRGAIDTGAEGLLREIGTVTEDLDPAGTVFVHGELWSAATTGPALRRGTRVRILGVERMQLRVAPAEDEPRPNPALAPQRP